MPRAKGRVVKLHIDVPLHGIIIIIIQTTDRYILHRVD